MTLNILGTQMTAAVVAFAGLAGPANAAARPALVQPTPVQDDTVTRGLIQKFVGSRGTTMFNGWSGSMSPGKRIQHHDMVGCLTVTRIQNWKRVAANEFTFDIVFTAEHSGESYL